MVHGAPTSVEHRQLDPPIVGPKAKTPHDARDTFRAQIERERVRLGPPRRRIGRLDRRFASWAEWLSRPEVARLDHWIFWFYGGCAVVFGANFQRSSARRQQRESFDEAVRQLELTLAGAGLTADSSIDPATRAAQVASAQAVLDRLRRAEPDGRVVLPLPDPAAPLPGALTLENNDALFIPPRPTTVGVFGAVYRPASFLLGDGQPLRLRDYLKMAGGTLRVADTRDIFVVRANGAVLSRRNGGLGARVLPGDVIFVPVKTQNTNLLAKIAQISTVIGQFAIGALAINAVTN